MRMKRKLIDLSPKTERILAIMAASRGMSLKKMIETLLNRAAEAYEEDATFAYLSKNYPDGQVMLDGQEHAGFIKWLGVTEK